MAFAGILGAVGSFFGPVGTAIGGAIGGAIDSNQASSAASNANQQQSYMYQNNLAYNAEEALKQRQFAEKESQVSRDFSQQMTYQSQDYMREMSGSSYQRAVKDMEAAGLNPMLAYSQGGASTPSSSAPSSAMGSGTSASAPSGYAPRNAKLEGIQAGLTTAQSLGVLQNLAVDVEKKRAETRNIETDTELKKAQHPRTEAETDYVRRQTQYLTEKLQQNFPRLEARKIEEEINLIYNQTGIRALEYDNAKKYFEARARGMTAEAALQELEIPRAKNIANQQGSWWMRNASPYIRDFSNVTNSAARGAYLLK